MSIWDMFKATPPAGATANPTVPTPGAQTAANPADPTQQSSLNNPPTGDASPLAGYSGMWNTENKGGDPTFSTNLSFDPTKISQAATKLDFKQVLDPALAQKALSGDAGALMDLIQQSSQATFAKAVQASGLMTQEAAKRQGDAITGSLPEYLRRQSSQLTASENKFFANPAVSPVIETIQKQLAITYPNATAAELKQHALAYFDGMAKEYASSSSPDPTAAKKAPGDQDWGAFFNV